MVDYDNALDVGPIGKVFLTGGGFVRREFSGWGIDSLFGWQQMVWKSPPKRGGTFKFENMDDIPVGLVARCELSTEFMNAQDYMDLRKIIGKERHFIAEFFDKDTGRWATREMYCSEDDNPSLLVLGQRIIGMRGISIKLVGTNRDTITTLDADGNEVTNLVTFEIKYSIPTGEGTANNKSGLEYGSQAVLDGGANIIAPFGKHLAGWVLKNGSNIIGWYGLGQSITVWRGMTLEPWYENA